MCDSIAGLKLTTEAMIADVLEKDESGGMGMQSEIKHFSFQVQY